MSGRHRRSATPGHPAAPQSAACDPFHGLVSASAAWQWQWLTIGWHLGGAAIGWAAAARRERARWATGRRPTAWAREPPSRGYVVTTRQNETNERKKGPKGKGKEKRSPRGGPGPSPWALKNIRFSVFSSVKLRNLRLCDTFSKAVCYL